MSRESKRHICMEFIPRNNVQMQKERMYPQCTGMAYKSTKFLNETKEGWEQIHTDISTGSSISAKSAECMQRWMMAVVWVILSAPFNNIK